MSNKLRIIPFSPSIYNSQKCIISSSEFSELEKAHGKFFDSYISIRLPSRACRLIVRCCKSSIGDVANVFQSDFRVTELLFPTLTVPNPSDPSSGESASKSESGVGHCATGLEKDPDWKSAYATKRELDLGRHLLAKMNSSGFDVDEDEKKSSVRFNDALWCTSKDMEMLKSGTIKMMRLTVISNSPLSDFLYHSNHQITGETPRKNSSIHQTTPNRIPGCRISSSWKLLREKVRQTFQSYDIHVKSNTLVDLRTCPLSSSGRSGCPSVSFVFVEECLFRNSESELGKVASKTEILINHVHHISYYQRQLCAFTPTNFGNSGNSTNSSQVQIPEVYGLENAMKVLTSLIEMQTRTTASTDTKGKCFPLMDNFYSHGLLIAGPSGCGKSLVVRETVKNLRANLLLFNFTGSVAKGKSEHDLSSCGDVWTQIFMDAVESGMIYPTVLLIPRVDECLLIKQNKSKNFATKLLNHVCTLLDSIPKGCKLTVVATTDKPYLVPGKLRRAGRLEREVYIGAPTEEERLNILKSLSRKASSLNKLDLDSVAKRTPGYVGQDLIRVAHLAILKSYEENCTEVADTHIKYALSRILPSVLQGTLGVVGIQRATSLDHIAGLHSVKHDLIKAIVWPLKYPQAFQIMGITPPKGILLHSPPGCAKTTLVRAVAASHQTNFLSVSAAELFSSGVGDSEKIVADLFHRARMASPCILFIDELEAIVGSRQMSQKGGKSTNESILSMLLTEMDGIGTLSPCVTDRTLQSKSNSLGPLVLVVAATNRIDMIDSALIRPGRFDKLIYVPPLDEVGRLELLQICSKTIPFSEDVDLEKIAADTAKYTGADLVNLCREAALLALSDNMESQSVSAENISTAKSMLRPSLT